MLHNKNQTHGAHQLHQLLSYCCDKTPGSRKPVEVKNLLVLNVLEGYEFCSAGRSGTKKWMWQVEQKVMPHILSFRQEVGKMNWERYETLKLQSLTSGMYFLKQGHISQTA